MQELFPPLSPEIRRALSLLPLALDVALPQNATHRRQLPVAVEELSTRLTSERGIDSKPYWSVPRLTSAYLRYFLPWNILRLTRLFSGLELPPPTPMPVEKNGEALPRILADMGSGPLSLPLALWLAKPQWRDLPLTVLCTDAVPHPLELGQKIFAEVAGADSPWRIVTARAPLDGLEREIRRLRGIPWLITAANVCNELKARPQQSLDQRLADLVQRMRPLLRAPDASLLLVEPGTRLGGKTIVALRQAALNCAMLPVAPCPHTGPCPLEDSRTWCHFTFDVQGCPAWLMELSGAANLRKEALSLAFTLLRADPSADTEEAAMIDMDDLDLEKLILGSDDEDHEDEGRAPLQRPVEGDILKARIVSAPFRVPGLPGMARYACNARGLALLDRADNLPSGSLVTVRPVVGQERRDAKSGALVLNHAENVPLAAHVPPDREYQPRREGPANGARPTTANKAPSNKAAAPKDSYRDKNKEEVERKPEKKRGKPAPKASKKVAKKFWEK